MTITAPPTSPVASAPRSASVNLSLTSGRLARWVPWALLGASVGLTLPVFLMLAAAEAIFSEEELPADQTSFTALNAELAKQWPVITEKKDAPADAKEWDGRPGKLEFLER